MHRLQVASRAGMLCRKRAQHERVLTTGMWEFPRLPAGNYQDMHCTVLGGALSWHLNSWVLDWLKSEGFLAPNQILERAEWSTKRRTKYANGIMDQLAEQGLKELWRDFKIQIDQAKASQVCVYSLCVWAPLPTFLFSAQWTLLPRLLPCLLGFAFRHVDCTAHCSAMD